MSVTSIERAKLGYGLGTEEGEAFWLFGMLETIKIGAEDTGGEYGVIEAVVRKGDGTPWHVHHEEDEWFYVLDGEFTRGREALDRPPTASVRGFPERGR